MFVNSWFPQAYFPGMGGVITPAFQGHGGRGAGKPRHLYLAQIMEAQRRAGQNRESLIRYILDMRTRQATLTELLKRRQNAFSAYTTVLAEV